MSDYKLFEVSDKLAVLGHMLEDAEDDSEVEAIMTEIESTTEDFAAKAKNIVGLMDAWEASAAGIKVFEDRLRARRTRLTKQHKRLKDYLLTNMITGNRKQISVGHGRTAICGVSRQLLEITDEGLIPDEFMRIKKEPDKTRIKTALDKNESVPGCTLTRRPTLQIK